MAIEPGLWDQEPPQPNRWPVRVLSFVAGVVIAWLIAMLLAS